MFILFKGSQNKEQIRDGKEISKREKRRSSLEQKRTSSLLRTSLNSRLIRWTAMLAMAGVRLPDCSCLEGGPGASLPVSRGLYGDCLSSLLRSSFHFHRLRAFFHLRGCSRLQSPARLPTASVRPEHAPQSSC